MKELRTFVEQAQFANLMVDKITTAWKEWDPEIRQNFVSALMDAMMEIDEDRQLFYADHDMDIFGHPLQ